MRKAWMFLMALAIAGAAHAQMYKWLDQDGKLRYGDRPPPGVKATPLKGVQPGLVRGPAQASGDASRAPLTPAEQEQEFRNRQRAAQKASEKSAQEAQAQAANQENCERSKASLRDLASGQRIARTNSGGERYFLDETQVAQETANAQQVVQQACK